MKLFMKLFIIGLFATINALTLYETCNRLSSLTYCGMEELDRRATELNVIIDTYLYNYEFDTHGIIGVSYIDETIYIALRGSHSKQNWKDDLDIRLIDYNHCSNCEVHEGFYNYAMSVYNETKESIDRLKLLYSSFDIVFTGHSLGSSVTLIALELYFQNHNSTVVTFGSPRLGNKEFATTMSILPTIRFTHYKDVVPHVPTIRFMHMLGEHYENEHGNITICQGYENETCANQHLLKDTNTNDHMYYLGYYMSCYEPLDNLLFHYLIL